MSLLDNLLKELFKASKLNHAPCVENIKSYFGKLPKEALNDEYKYLFERFTDHLQNERFKCCKSNAKASQDKLKLLALDFRKLVESSGENLKSAFLIIIAHIMENLQVITAALIGNLAWRFYVIPTAG